eukprot:scaffold7458_cov89-Skeletonema_marinoi.AAC.2
MAAMITIMIMGGDAVGESSSNVDKERERMDGLFIIDALATRMKEMDALSLGCSSSSPLFKKKKNKMGQSRSADTARRAAIQTCCRSRATDSL